MLEITKANLFLLIFPVFFISSCDAISCSTKDNPEGAECDAAAAAVCCLYRVELKEGGESMKEGVEATKKECADKTKYPKCTEKCAKGDENKAMVCLCAGQNCNGGKPADTCSLEKCKKALETKNNTDTDTSTKTPTGSTKSTPADGSPTGTPSKKPVPVVNHTASTEPDKTGPTITTTKPKKSPPGGSNAASSLKMEAFAVIMFIAFGNQIAE